MRSRRARLTVMRQLEEQTGDYLKAAAAYRVLVEQYPKSPHFNEAIEAQFRIGEMYLDGQEAEAARHPDQKRRWIARSRFSPAIVRSAPYGKYTARAQFNIGLATEKQGNAEQAVRAYQAVVEKFPDDPVAADAQYQIGYIWFNALAHGARRREGDDEREASVSRISSTAIRRARRPRRRARTCGRSSRSRRRTRSRSRSFTTSKRTTAPR